MFGISAIDPDNLVALRFADGETFRQAARVAAEKRIPVDAPGKHTLIVRHTDVGLFQPLNPKVESVADPEKVPAKDLAALRRRHMR